MTIADGILFGILIIASLQDIEEMSLPNLIPGFAFLVGVFSLITGIGISPWQGVLGAVVAFGTMFLIATMPVWLYYAFKIIGLGKVFNMFVSSKTPTLGGADIKLMTVVGLFLGWKLVLAAILFSYFAGAVIGVYGMFSRTLNRQAYIPLVPSILAGTWAAINYGQVLIHMYTNIFFA